MSVVVRLAKWHAHSEEPWQKPIGLHEMFNAVQEMLQRQA